MTLNWQYYSDSNWSPVFTLIRLNVKFGGMDVYRPLWLNRLSKSWQATPIVWLSGVRRVGKTTLAGEVPNATYLNCDLPRHVERLSDPESFYSSLKTAVVILDEVHQLPDPSRLLKIGADVFPKLKILATGSSTLAATNKFRDSLTGRKRQVHLLPVLFEELISFGITDIRERLIRGGLPPVLLGATRDEEFYAEWMDSYYARDVQELFKVEKRTGFMRLLRLLLRQSGGLIEVTKLARDCELSRPTVMNYLEVFEATHVVIRLIPHSGKRRGELVSQPKIYCFDTGFVAFERGWRELRGEDCGILWEHIVLETLQSIPSVREIKFWRDKEQREIDFVLPVSDDTYHAIECKWGTEGFDAKNLKTFRALYPQGKNLVIAPHRSEPHTRKLDGLNVTFASPTQLRELLVAS